MTEVRKQKVERETGSTEWRHETLVKTETVPFPVIALCSVEGLGGSNCDVHTHTHIKIPADSAENHRLFVLLKHASGYIIYLVSIKYSSFIFYFI